MLKARKMLIREKRSSGPWLPSVLLPTRTVRSSLLHCLTKVAVNQNGLIKDGAVSVLEPLRESHIEAFQREATIALNNLGAKKGGSAPAPAPKKEEPKKEAPKKEEPKKEEAKPASPKAEPKKGAAKKESRYALVLMSFCIASAANYWQLKQCKRTSNHRLNLFSSEEGSSEESSEEEKKPAKEEAKKPETKPTSPKTEPKAEQKKEEPKKEEAKKPEPQKQASSSQVKKEEPKKEEAKKPEPPKQTSSSAKKAESSGSESESESDSDDKGNKEWYALVWFS